jgi:hypothetical protein
MDWLWHLIRGHRVRVTFRGWWDPWCGRFGFVGCYDCPDDPEPQYQGPIVLASWTTINFVWNGFGGKVCGWLGHSKEPLREGTYCARCYTRLTENVGDTD